MWSSGFGVQGVDSRVWGSGCQVQGLGFSVWVWWFGGALQIDVELPGFPVFLPPLRKLSVTLSFLFFITLETIDE